MGRGSESEGNSLLHRLLAAGDQGDLEAFDELLHHNVVVHAPMGLSTIGIDEEKRVWRQSRLAIPDLLHEIRELVESGQVIAARVRVSGTHAGEFVGLPGTGRRFAIDQATFVRVEDGKAIEVWEIADTASFLAQVRGDIPPAED